VSTDARDAGPHYSAQRRNMSRGPVGRVSGSRSSPRPSSCTMIGPSGCIGRRSPVRDAAATWGMCSPTDRGRRGIATALIRSRWNSSRSRTGSRRPILTRRTVTIPESTRSGSAKTMCRPRALSAAFHFAHHATGWQLRTFYNQPIPPVPISERPGQPFGGWSRCRCASNSGHCAWRSRSRKRATRRHRSKRAKSSTGS
jgi:hypothetical protein